jgi:galactokinase
MLLDCRDRSRRMVPMGDLDVVVLVTNSMVKHELSGGEYAQRRAECESAAAKLGVSSLREATYQQLMSAKPTLEALEFKRAHHVITEIERTERAAGLLGAQDCEGFGRLMFDSHASLRDRFEVSCRELDVLVEMAQRFVGQGVYGARMTGGGFGGCTVTLLRAEAVEPVSRFIAEHYPKHAGVHPTLFTTRPAAGAMRLSLPGA